MWFWEYKLESASDLHALASFPYDLLITHILNYYLIDLPGYPIVEVSAT